MSFSFFNSLKVKCQSFSLENTSKEIQYVKIVNAMDSLTSQYVTEKVHFFINFTFVLVL